MKFNSSFKRRGSSDTVAAQSPQSQLEGFEHVEFSIKAPDWTEAKSVCGDFQRREDGSSMLKFRTGPISTDEFFVFVVTRAIQMGMASRFGVPADEVAENPFLAAIFERACDTVLLDLCRRHTTGGCGREECTSCGSQYHPNNSPSSIDRALQAMDPVVTEFDMTHGKGTIILRFTTDRDFSRTVATTVFGSDKARAEFERYVASVKSSHDGEEGGES